MKKILFCALIGVTLYACKSDKKPEAVDTTKTAALDSAAADSNFKLTNIGLDEAVALVTRYKTGMVSTHDNLSTKENTRAVYFDLATLKTLITKIEGQKGNGLRIYFATYDDKHVVEVPNPTTQKPDTLDYANSNTVVLVSTKDEPANDPANPKKIIHRDYYSDDKSMKNIGFFVGKFTEPQNKGELCPPPNPCCTIGATLLCTPPPSSKKSN